MAIPFCRGTFQSFFSFLKLTTARFQGLLQAFGAYCTEEWNCWGFYPVQVDMGWGCPSSLAIWPIMPVIYLFQLTSVQMWNVSDQKISVVEVLPMVMLSLLVHSCKPTQHLTVSAWSCSSTHRHSSLVLWVFIYLFCCYKTITWPNWFCIKVLVILLASWE